MHPDNTKAAADLWGDILPGTVFWQEVEAPENQILLDVNKARKLKPPELRLIQIGIQKRREALAIWDHEHYPDNLRSLAHKIRRVKDSDREQAVELVRRYRELEASPPPAPPKIGMFRRFWRWMTGYKPFDIPDAKTAELARRWITKAEQRIAEHNEAVNADVIYEQLARQMELEVGYFGQQLRQRWTALGEREDVYKKGKLRRRSVIIDRAVYTPDEIQFKVKVATRGLLGVVKHHLPDGVAAWSLVKPETLAELSAACERPVGSPHTENTSETFENGCWVVVYREGLTDGLFDFVDYDTVARKYEDKYRSKYPIPLGVKRGRMVEWLNLSQTPHLMVNGIPGSGKTNVIRVFLTTLTARHTPAEMRFIVVDLKRGGDFREFSVIPHMAGPIITKTDDLVEIVPRLVAIMQHRMETYYNLAARDIDDYNGMVQTADRMPRIMLVIDECNSIDNLASKGDREIIWRGLTLIATQARAAGIHLLLGTQQSFSDSIPKSVRDNITFVLSGRQRTLAASMATFGTGTAKKLPNIRGRMWCDDGNDIFQIQTPYVSKDTIHTVVEAALAYGDVPPLLMPEVDDPEAVMAAPVFGLDDVIRIAVEEFEGVLGAEKIKKTSDVPDEVSVRQMYRFVDEIVNRNTVIYNGKTYTAVKYGRGWRLIDESTNRHAYNAVDSTVDSLSIHEMAGD